MNKEEIEEILDFLRKELSEYTEADVYSGEYKKECEMLEKTISLIQNLKEKSANYREFINKLIEENHAINDEMVERGAKLEAIRLHCVNELKQLEKHCEDEKLNAQYDGMKAAYKGILNCFYGGENE
jgi:hypothetical protein